MPPKKANNQEAKAPEAPSLDQAAQRREIIKMTEQHYAGLETEAARKVLLMNVSKSVIMDMELDAKNNILQTEYTKHGKPALLMMCVQDFRFLTDSESRGFTLIDAENLPNAEHSEMVRTLGPICVLDYVMVVCVNWLLPKMGISPTPFSAVTVVTSSQKIQTALAQMTVVVRCTTCNRSKALDDEKFLACSGCHDLLYCSKACQKQDWIGKHKKECPSRLAFKFTPSGAA
jgi:hypothetical protein